MLVLFSAAEIAPPLNPSNSGEDPPDTPALQPPEHVARIPRGAPFAAPPPVMLLMLSSPSSPQCLPRIWSLYFLA